jgi:hypothetical protein
MRRYVVEGFFDRISNEDMLCAAGVRPDRRVHRAAAPNQSRREKGRQEMKFRRVLLVLFAVFPLAAAGLAVAAGAFDGAKPATARFHDLDKAMAAGYSVKVVDVNGITCIAQPGEGAMGVHMLNPALFDSTIDATAPEALVYEPKANGRLKLVALEYLVLQSAWKGSSPPSLFGRQFDSTASPNRYGLPPFYSLHAWIWKPNPSGILYAWNPRVEC